MKYKRLLKTAQKKLTRELDLVQFIRRQRSTVIGTMALLNVPQYLMARHLAKMTVNSDTDHFENIEGSHLRDDSDGFAGVGKNQKSLNHVTTKRLLALNMLDIQKTEPKSFNISESLNQVDVEIMAKRQDNLMLG